MRRLLAPTFLILCALTTSSDGQTITSTDIDRAIGPGTYVPRDGMSYNEWYSYNTGAFFYPGGNPRALMYQDYLDRLDRAYKFGYRIPQDPYTVPYNRAPMGGRVGMGLGFFRWR